MRHEAIRVENLLYKGCESHWQCIHCGDAVPIHCYDKGDFERKCCGCHKIRCDGCDKKHEEKKVN